MVHVVDRCEALVRRSSVGADSPRAAECGRWPGRHPGYALGNARFLYVEYNDIHQLVHLRSMLSKHTNVLVDAGPELLLSLHIWLEAREAGRLL